MKQPVNVPSGKRGRQVTIRDQDALCEVIRRLVDREHSQVGAARVLGITEGAIRAYLIKNRNGTNRKGLNTNTVAALYEAFPPSDNGDIPEEWTLLARALLPEDGYLVSQSYDTWLDSRTNAFVKRRTGRWLWTEQGVAEIAAGNDSLKATRLGEMCYVIGLLVSTYPKIFEPLRIAYEQYQPEYDRYVLALIRVVEPLLEARESGFIELGWEELLDKERRQERVTRKSLRRYPLREFLTAGVEREEMLLKRASDEDRAHAATQEPAKAADPDWASLLSQRAQTAGADTHQKVWREIHNYYQISANNLGIKKLDLQCLLHSEK